LYSIETMMTNSQMFNERPWGYYDVLLEDPEHKVKRIVVYPGKRLSLQCHKHRDEHWIIAAGEGRMTVDHVEFPLGKGSFVNIPRRSIHRVSNTGQTNLIFIEVQTGDYFDESDIQRFEDDYGRV
jgi:mannose-6-phosphate isomerase